MEQQPVFPEVEIPEMQEPDIRSRVRALCHAILILFAAYALVYALYGVFEHNGYPLIFLIGVVSLFSLTLIFGLLSGGKPGPHAIAALLFGLIAGAYPILCSGIALFGYVYLHVAALSYTYFVLALFGNHSRSMSGTLLLDLVKATFCYPFLSFASLFTALFRRSRGSKKLGRAVLFTLIGIGVALILGVIAVALLSYDPKFKAIFTFDWDWDDIPDILLRLILTVPLAALLFGAYTSSREKKLPNMNTPESAASFAARLQRIPAVVLVIPAFVLLAIYGVFFFTQWDAYVGAFSGKLPASFTAAEYARSGFFELCAVAAINALLGAALSLFMRQTERVSVVLKKLVNTLMAIATLILIATALSKMFLYIKRFDLTVMRLFASTVLVMIAIGFLASILAQWINRIRVIPILVVCTAVLLLAVPFANVRGRIAAYNVDQYLLREEQNVAGNTIDVWYLCGEVAADSLGTAGVPDAVRLLQHETESSRSGSSLCGDLRNHLKTIYTALKDRPVSERSLSDVRALAALETLFGGNS